MTTFDDEVTSIMPDERDLAYEHLATSYREAFNDMWNKSQEVDIDAILNSVQDKHLAELQKLKWLMTGSKDQPKVVEENRQVPELDQILGAMTSKLPEKALPDRKTCTKISNVFSGLAGAHKLQAKAAEGLAELAETVSPEQLTLILAAAITPALQLALLPGSISPLSVPPPPPPVTPTEAGRSDLIAYCKRQILPNAKASSIQKYAKRHPTRVLAAALYTKIEQRYFKEKTARAEVAAMFYVTTNQLTKAVTGIDYKGGPHASKRKRPTDANSTTTLAKAPKASATATPSTSTKTKASSSKKMVHEKHTGKQQDSDMLSSSTSSTESDSLPDVDLGSSK